MTTKKNLQDATRADVKKVNAKIKALEARVKKLEKFVEVPSARKAARRLLGL